MAKRNPIRNVFETALTRLGFLIVPFFPRALVVALARFFGTAAFLFSGQMRRLGRTNLDIAFGDTKTRAEKDAILRRSFQSFALVLLDTFWFFRHTAKRIARHVQFAPCYEQVLFREKRHICVTAHYGNWEILGMAITWRGFPLHSVAKPLKNEVVDRLFIEARHKTGQKIVKREGAVRTLLRILQQNGKIALVMDQNTRLYEGGIFFPFFGLPASFASTAAALALKTKTDIAMCMIRPGPNGIYQAHYCTETPVEPFLAMEPAVATTALTRRIIEEMETFIRNEPEFWLWTYKRWKYIPDGENPSRYPYYARPAV